MFFNTEIVKLAQETPENVAQCHQRQSQKAEAALDKKNLQAAKSDVPMYINSLFIMHLHPKLQNIHIT